MTQTYDACYKLLFSLPELVRDLISEFVPDDWLRNLDYDTLEKVSGTYITDDLRQRTSDVVWRIRIGEEWVYLYFLIEFQSTVDTYMAVRMMTYMGLLYQELVRTKTLLPQGKLPPVLPLVFYNGSSRWNAATSINELSAKAPAAIEHYQPDFAYLLVDTSQFQDSDLKPLKNLVAIVLRIERAKEQKTLTEMAELLSEMLSSNPELDRTFSIAIRGLLWQRSRQRLYLPDVKSMKELRMSLEESFEMWADQYKLQGEAVILQKILTQRFGTLPAEVISRIQSATLDRLDVWVDRLDAATCLDDIFQDRDGRSPNV